MIVALLQLRDATVPDNETIAALFGMPRPAELEQQYPVLAEPIPIVDEMAPVASTLDESVESGVSQS